MISDVPKVDETRLACLGRAALALQRINHPSNFLTESQVQQLLQSLVDIIYLELKYPNCQIFLKDETGRELEFKCGTGYLFEENSRPELLRKWRPRLTEEAGPEPSGLIGWTGRYREALIIPDVRKEPRFMSFGSEVPTLSELTVPLLYNNELIGVLDIQSTVLNAFDDLDLEMVSYFGTQAASLVYAVNQGRLTISNQENLNILALTSSLINNQVDLSELGRLVLENVIQVLNAASGTIWLLEDAPLQFQRLTAINLNPTPTFRPLYLNSQLLNSIENRKILFVSNLDEYDAPVEVRERLRVSQIEAFSCIPLSVRDQVLGLMFINYREPHRFTGSDKQLISIFGDQTAAALLNARLRIREQTARRMAESLVRSIRLVSSQLESEAVLQTIADEVTQVLGVPMCSLSLLDEKSEYINFGVVAGGTTPETKKVRLKVGEGFVGTVAATGRMWKEYDFAVLPAFANNPTRIRENWRAGIALPIKVGSERNSRIIGVLCAHDHVPRNFTAEEVAYLEGLADQAAVTLSIARNFGILRHERDKYQALLENANDPIFLLNPAGGEIIDANQRATEATGYSYEELLGQPVSLLYPSQERAKIERLQQQEMMKGELGADLVENILVQRKDGSLFPASYSARLVQVGAVRIIIQIVRDVSERQAIEQQLVRNEKLRALGQLASGVAHDFNNLLTGILGVSELLLDGVPDDQENRLLKMLRQSALDGAHMVRRLQLLGPRQENNGFSPLEINGLLNDVIELTRPRWRGTAQQRGISIEVEVETEMLPPVNANASELREVITNLVLNAVDAMPTGGRLSLRTERHAKEAWIIIQDTGIGMSQETQRHLFEPFYTTKAREGHGLGLSVSNSIIDRHNGTIEVDSALGKGSCFTLKLPLAKTAEDTARPKAEASTSETKIIPRRILIVEDEPNLLYILNRLLQADRHIVTATTSGLEAIRLFSNNPDDFDLVLSDLSIADSSGWDVAQAVKNLRPEMPIALVTGWGAELDPEMLRSHGISEVVNKPYRLNEVRSTVNRLVNPGHLPRTFTK